MKILIATDSFKDCLSADEVGNNIAKGLKGASANFNTRIVPMGDGGEGTVQALINASGGSFVSCKVKDPLMRDISASYGISGDGQTAVIEMAAASGIELLKPEERNPWHTSTYGTGQLIIDALNRGCTRFICGIGGSATNDGGVGMATAIGAKLLDKNGNEILSGGGELKKIFSIDITQLDSRLMHAEFIIACDVTNPLTGEFGASSVYGPQKGADAKMVEELDQGLEHYASKIKEYIHKDVKDIPGSGAAGGLGAGFVAFLEGKLRPGIEIVLEETDLEEHCRWADIVITGEGKIDHQTAFGKTPQGVANVAKKHNVPVIAVAGTLGEHYRVLYSSGFDAIYSIIDKPMQLEEALKEAPVLLENIGFTIGKMLSLI